MHQDSDAPQHRENNQLPLDSDRVTDVIEAERRDLADLIETEIVQQLNLLLSQAGAYEITLADNPTARLAISVLASLGREALQRARDLEANLKPAVLDALGLEPALESLVGQAARAHGYRVALIMERGKGRLLFQFELALFRLVQNALQRAARAGATRCTIQLTRSADGVELKVSDNGKSSVSLNILESVCYRLEQLGATVTVQENGAAHLEITVHLIIGVSPDLTNREMETLRLLASGMSNKEIAKALNISARTVNFHLDNIYSKLGINSRSEAIVHAIQRGWTRGTAPD